MTQHATFRMLILCLMLVLLCSCGGGGVIDGNGGNQNSTWNVGSTRYTFNIVGAAIYPSNNHLHMIFHNTTSSYPNADVNPGDASAIKVGEPAILDEEYDIELDIDSDKYYLNDPDSPCELLFTTLEMTTGGKIAGTITGTLFADLDEDGTRESYPLSASFVGVFTIM